MFINLLAGLWGAWREVEGAHTAAFVDATLGLSFCVMHDKKRKKIKKQMCGKAVECLQQLKGRQGGVGVSVCVGVRGVLF